MDQSCSECGASFGVGPQSGKKLTCSSQCSSLRSSRVAKENRKVVEVQRACSVCKKVFMASGAHANLRTCSPECAHVLRKEAASKYQRSHYVKRVNTREEILCVQCGTKFQPRLATQIYCSRLCGRSGAQEKKRHKKVVRVCSKCGIAVQRKSGIPVCADCQVDKRERGKEHEQRRRLRAYGITQEQYDEMMRSQGGQCAICRTEEPGQKGWQIDHDHENGNVRGLLCRTCNLSLGYMEDDPKRLEAAAAYLRSNLE